MSDSLPLPDVLTPFELSVLMCVFLGVHPPPDRQGAQDALIKLSNILLVEQLTNHGRYSLTMRGTAFIHKGLCRVELPCEMWGYENGD